MKHTVNDNVVIIKAIPNLTAPGAKGVIRQYRITTFDTEYNVFIPSRSKTRWLHETDIMSESEWIRKSAEIAVKQQLFDFALDQNNKQMFNSLQNNTYVMFKELERR